MTDRSDEGRHAAPDDASGSARHPDPADDPGYERPDGVPGGFAPRPDGDAPSSYRPPPPTVSPADQAVFGRPDGAEAFRPAPGERLAPRHTTPAPVPRVFEDSFGAPTSARDGFDPAPGDRLHPSGPAPGSPWWKADAPRDPWRDPSSPFWLGRGAVFGRGGPSQVAPDEDTETDPDDLAAKDGDDEDLEKGSSDNVRRVRFGPKLSVIAVVAVLIAGVIGGVVGWWVSDNVDELHRPDANIAQVETPVQRPAGSIAGIAKRVGPAVVSIAVTTKTQYAIGSGVVIDDNGDVLTNNHVVAPAVDAGDEGKIVVTFSNEATAEARVVGRDPESDLAVIKVPTDDLTVATLGKSSQMAVGDPVVAIGSPLGLQGTVTSGIVSALNRPVRVSSDDGGTGAYYNAIQTDAPINPGNSGGALVNSSGAVIGINSAAALGTVGPNGSGAAITGIGYAIPIDYARSIALQLIRTGKAEHASIGLQGRTVVSSTPGRQVGGYIVQVSPNGPGAKAGLKQGDVIVAADGQVIQTFDQLTVIVLQKKPGDRLEVTYYVKDSTRKRTVTVTLDEG
ncbi:S1C family serine protease [Jatrophihabitans fulvus]